MLNPRPSNIVPAKMLPKDFTEVFASEPGVITKLERVTISSHSATEEIVDLYVGRSGELSPGVPLIWKLHVHPGEVYNISGLEEHYLNPEYSLYTKTDVGDLVTLNVSVLLYREDLEANGESGDNAEK